MKKATLHFTIILLTMALFSYSCFSSLENSPTVSSANTQIQKLPVSGMTYLIVNTPQGITLANVTKDSLEVAFRKRSQLYIELTNKQLKAQKP